MTIFRSTSSGAAHAVASAVTAIFVMGAHAEPVRALPPSVPEAPQCSRNQQHTCQQDELDRISSEDILACGLEDYGVLCCDAAGWSCCGEDDICMEGDFWSSRPGAGLRDRTITGSNSGASGRLDRGASGGDRLRDRFSDRLRDRMRRPRLERDRRTDRRGARDDYRRRRGVIRRPRHDD